MNLSQFTSMCENQLQSFSRFVKAHLPVKGNTSETCQHTAIQNKILEVQMNLNGLEDEDMVQDPNFTSINNEDGFSLGSRVVNVMSCYSFEVPEEIASAILNDSSAYCREFESYPYFIDTTSMEEADLVFLSEMLHTPPALIKDSLLSISI